MRAASISDIKQELTSLPPKQLLEVCLKLARFKKENKELLTYLLFEEQNEHGFVESIKLELDEHFSELPHKSWFLTKKSLRKILRLVGRYSKYTTSKESEVELLIHFCTKVRSLNMSFQSNQTLTNLYNVQIKKIHALLKHLHEDVLYDYTKQVQQLEL